LAARIEKAIIYISILLGLLYHCALIFRPAELLPDRPYNDDAFYSLSVAKNLSQARLFSVDGSNKTNGFQPLFTILSSIPYFITTNKYLAIRIMHVLHLIVHLCSAYLFARLISIFSEKSTTRLFAFAAWMISYTVIKYSANGLETGFYLLMLLWSSNYYLLHVAARPGISHHLLFGIMLGLTTLTRIDAGFLCLSCGAHYIVCRKPFRETVVERLTPPLLWFSSWIVITLPWWVYNYHIASSVLPISGKVQTLFYKKGSYFPVEALCENLYFSVHALLDHAYVFFITPVTYIMDFSALSFLWLAVKVLFILCMLIAFNKVFKRIFSRQRKNLYRLSFFVLFVGLQFIFYNFYFYACWYSRRYLIPFIIVSLLFWLLFLETQRHTHRMVFLAAGILCTVVLGGSTYFKSYNTMYTEHYGWVRNNVPPGLTVAASQSGTLGYFHEKTVNLDGKVNADIYRLDKNRLGEYLVQQDVAYIIEWKEFNTVFKNESITRLYEYHDSYGRCAILKRNNAADRPSAAP